MLRWLALAAQLGGGKGPWAESLPLKLIPKSIIPLTGSDILIA